MEPQAIYRHHHHQPVSTCSCPLLLLTPPLSSQAATLCFTSKHQTVSVCLCVCLCLNWQLQIVNTFTQAIRKLKTQQQFSHFSSNVLIQELEETDYDRKRNENQRFISSAFFSSVSKNAVKSLSKVALSKVGQLKVNLKSVVDSSKIFCLFWYKTFGQ